MNLISKDNITKLLLLLVIIFTSHSVSAKPLRVISLDGTDWELSYWPQPATPVTTPQQVKQLKAHSITAIVPGNVEIDLQRAGIIEDPMVGSNVYKLRAWEGHQWCYTRAFQAPQLKSGETCMLRFQGIDCLADVWLDDHHLGSPNNMLIEHSYDITSYLRTGKKHILTVILRSALLEAHNHTLGTISIGNFPAEESIYTRKAPHMFGWDIMPRLVSAGLWRSVELDIMGESRIRELQYMTTRIDGNNASGYLDMQLQMPFERYDHTIARVRFSRNGKQVYEFTHRIHTPATRMEFYMPNVELWWPHGYGEAALYDAHIDLVDEVSGEVLDQDDRRIGIRTIQLERTEINLPEKPGQFLFRVNGVPIFVRGTNWVPLDALHSRDGQHLLQTIEMTADLNCNMVRCWGGNVYESDEFYELCDQYGLMVWQDFTMGCSLYPQRQDFLGEIEAEAISVVIRLRNHPCIVLWAGNNENDSSAHWSMAPFDINPNKDYISRVVLPRVLYEFDPTRPFLPSSPYVSQEAYEHGSNEGLIPEVHLWGPRGYYKAAYYTDNNSQFVSEIGYHGCPNRESLERMMSPDCVYPWSHDHQWNEEWLTKSVRRFPELGQTNDRNNLMLNQIRLLFGEIPSDLDNFIKASQIVQAEAMKFFVELWRGHKFAGRNGIIWWNVRDGWPLISDAIVDYYNSKKLAYDYIKNAQQNVCCMICDIPQGNEVIVVNDTPQPQSGIVKVTNHTDGSTVYEAEYHVESNGRVVLANLPKPTGQGIYHIQYTTSQGSYKNHYLYGEPPFKLDDYKQWMNIN